METTLLEATTLTIDGGIPGFPAACRFELTRWGGAESPFSLLRCVDNERGTPQFVVMPPTVFFPGYRCDVDAGTIDRLGIESVADVSVFVILTLGGRPEDATANLLAPLLVNRWTGQATQTVLVDPDPGYGLRVPLTA